MPWAGGVYTRGYPSWTNDANANLPISATKFDTEDNDFASGLNNCLTIDGLNKPNTALTWAQALTVASLSVTGNTAAVNGLYLPGGTSLGFTTASTQRGTISANGNWTIANATSGIALAVSGQIASIGNSTLSSATTGAFFNGGNSAQITQVNSAGGTDSKMWDCFVDTTTLHARILNDAQNVTLDWMDVIRTATTSAIVKFVDDAGALQTVGWRDIPQNIQTGNYTTVLADRGKHLWSSTASITWTIAANASVPYPNGATIVFINRSVGNISIAINSDTLVLAGIGSTGTRTLATNSVATAVKTESTVWMISGTGLT